MNEHKTNTVEIQTKSPEILKEVTGLTERLLAEVLSYLPKKEPILTSIEGLNFFSDRELVFTIKIRDKYRISWAECKEYLGSENLYSPSIAYNYFNLYHETPGWDAAYQNNTPFVSMLHPYVPACSLKRIPENKENLTNLISTWAEKSLKEKDAWRYGMWLACIVGNLELVRSLVNRNCNPSEDDFHNAIRNKHYSVVKFIVDSNEKFKLNICQYSFSLSIENGTLDIFTCMLEAFSPDNRLEIRGRSLKEAEQILRLNPESPAIIILGYLTNDIPIRHENTPFTLYEAKR